MNSCASRQLTPANEIAQIEHRLPRLIFPLVGAPEEEWKVWGEESARLVVSDSVYHPFLSNIVLDSSFRAPWGVNTSRRDVSPDRTNESALYVQCTFELGRMAR